MDSSSRECVPKLRGGEAHWWASGRHRPMAQGPRRGTFRQDLPSPPPLCWDCFPPHTHFTHGRCPGGAGKCHSQISRRSRSGAGPCCLWWGNKLAIGWWARRWEQGHGAPSCCETETQRVGKRAGGTSKVPIWWPWLGGVTRADTLGSPGPLSSWQPRGGTTAANGAEVMAEAWLGSQGRGDGNLSKSDDGRGTAWGGRSSRGDGRGSTSPRDHGHQPQLPRGCTWELAGRRFPCLGCSAGISPASLVLLLVPLGPKESPQPPAPARWGSPMRKSRTVMSMRSRRRWPLS